MQWEAFCGHKLGKFDNFKDAMSAVFDEVFIVTEKNMSYQILETATWVVSDHEGDLPIMFYTLRDIACDLGFIKDGRWTKE